MSKDIKLDELPSPQDLSADQLPSPSDLGAAPKHLSPMCHRVNPSFAVGFKVLPWASLTKH